MRQDTPQVLLNSKMAGNISNYAMQESASPNLNDSLWSDNSDEDNENLGGLHKDVCCFIISGIGNQISLKVKRISNESTS